MPAVKPLDRISNKWARQSAAATSEYQQGVANPRTPWAEATAAASDRYAQGVQQAISQNRFQTGVRTAGNAKWQERASTLGPGRWAEGIRNSTSAYERGFAPYRQVIENTQLPPRGPKGDPANIERVRVIDQNLHDAKMSRSS